MVNAKMSESAEGIVPLEALYLEYGPRLQRLARRLLGNAADAEDAVQDAFVLAQAHLATFRGEASLSTWLYRLTRNAILAYRRKRAVRERHRVVERGGEQVLETAVRPAETAAMPADPSEQALEHEREELVDQTIARLPAEQRDVLVLADLEELPLAQVAERLGLTEPAAKGRLHRARCRLRRCLGPQLDRAE